MNQMRQAWIKSVKLSSPKVTLGGHESHQVVLRVNQVVLGQISKS